MPDEKLPEGYETWSDDAREAYQQVLERATSAEQALDRIRAMVISSEKENTAKLLADSTLNWQAMIVTTVHHLAQQAVASLDPTPTLYEIVQLLAQIMQGTSAYVSSWNPELGGILILAEHIAPEANDREKVSDVGAILPAGPDFEKRLLQAGYWITQHDDLNISHEEKVQFDLYDIKTTIYAPMMTADGKLIGHLEVWDTRHKRTFAPRQIEFLTIIASQFAGAVRNVGLLRALRQSEARYGMLVRTMNEGLIQIDSGGSIQYANERFGILVGQSPEALIGTRLESLWIQDSQEISPESVQTAYDSVREVSFHRPDNRVVWTQVSVSPVTDIRGEVTGYVHVYTDITQRREAEQKAIGFALEQERVRILAEFIRDASHEFYTPLSVIRTRVYLLSRMLQETKPYQHLETIQAQTESILKLINDLVTMTALDSAVNLRLQQTNLNELVGYAITNLESCIHEKQLRVNRDLQPDSLSVRVDGDKMLRAIYAILENAVNHTPDGGSIYIRTGISGQQAFVEVQDTGSGISAEIIEQIFQRFYRKDTAHSTRGFGLGLAIARRAVELHGGYIEVKSPPGEGAVFYVWLPL